jgi:uncharacterized protein (DUF2252 family)
LLAPLERCVGDQGGIGGVVVQDLRHQLDQVLWRLGCPQSIRQSSSGAGSRAVRRHFPAGSRAEPIRYGRMQADPFAFLRGAAAVMAADLARTPATGIRMQACGDAHLANFGSYATPEGLPVFDINDFDETLPAPFEWDLKRLAASLVVAGRVAQYPEKAAVRGLARTAARSYREHMAELARLPPVDAWNRHIDLARAIADIDQPKVGDMVEKRLAQVLESGAKHFGLAEEKGGGVHIREKPPLVYHLSKHALPARKAFASYAETLQEDRRVLLHRHTLRDVAFKAVGVGSVGTFCAIGLLAAGDGSPLLLQIKEAQESVLAPFAGASDYANHGERVVVGQRMMQAATDVFLGWTRAPIDQRYFYIRRLKDSRLADIGTQLQAALPFYASLCGRTLARAHARAGDPALVSGYGGSAPPSRRRSARLPWPMGTRPRRIGTASWQRSRLGASYR